MKNKWRSIPFVMSLLFAIVLFLAACGGGGAGGGGETQPVSAGTANSGASSNVDAAAGKDPEMQKLYELAKQEGELIYWSPTGVAEETAIANEFSKAFPGIKVTPFNIKPGNAVERIITESRSGRVSVDLLSTSIGSAAPLLERDMLEPFTELANMDAAIKNSLMLDGKYSNVYNLDYVIGYNTQLIPPELAPKNWEDLLNPELKGKIGIEVRAMPFGFLGLAWGEEKMMEFLKQIKDTQQPFFVKGGTTIAEQVASGESPIAIGLYSYQMDLLIKDGAPVGYAIPDPLGITNFGNVLIKGAPHPNAAKLYAAWAASEEGQKIMEAQLGRGSLLPDSPLPQAKRIKDSGTSVTYENLDNFVLRKQLEEGAAAALGSM